MKVLSWITCAKRPLTASELRCALAVKVGKSELDPGDLPQTRDMVSACAGLVTVEEESEIIRLVHYTTQKYFERAQTTWFPSAQKDITRTCITYLSFDTFGAGFCKRKTELNVRLRLYPLYDYATRNWGYHAWVSSTQVDHLMLDFLESDAKVSAASQAMKAYEIIYPYCDLEEDPMQLRGIHLTAYFGLTNVMECLVKMGHDPNLKDSSGKTALSWAVSNGRDTMAKLLLATEGVDPNSCDERSRTPLLLAIQRGHETIAKLLLEKDGIDANIGSYPARNWCDVHPSQFINTSLGAYQLLGHRLYHRYSRHDRDNTFLGGVRLLESVGLEILDLISLEDCATLDEVFDVTDEDGRTPLECAAMRGHEGFVKLLLSKDGVNINGQRGGRPSLLLAAANGHVAVVKLLLAKGGVKVDSKDRFGWTPLSWAARNGHETVARLLLAEDGVDADSKDYDGRTPLSWAAASGHEAVVRLLLAKDGVDPDSRDRLSGTSLFYMRSGYGWSPLSWAASNGHDTVVRLLLARNSVDPNSKHINGWTPLSQAAKYGHEAVVKLLLAEDSIALDPKDDSRMSPLYQAQRKGHEAVVKLILKKV
jgi:ankyrin repeat protein